MYDNYNTSNLKTIEKAPMTPELTITEKALEQLKLIYENDPTVVDKVVRISITGKGCQGFEYAIGFDEMMIEDLKIKLLSIKFEKLQEIVVVMDPFCAFYLKQGRIMFIQEFEGGSEEEGFVIVNDHQKDVHGKFWKTKPKAEPLYLLKKG